MRTKTAPIVPPLFTCPYCGKPIPNADITRASGSIGGMKTANRGPEYYRQLQAKRKTKAGGRPPANKLTQR